MKGIKCCLAFSILLFCSSLHGQTVGLVLSGGGAKGLYHVGVIKALEENGIPIDYISGTSMGAIVAGLYAIGYTPDEIAEQFTSPQMQYWLTGEIENKYKYYFKQMRQTASMIGLHLDPKKKKNKASIYTSSIVPTSQMDLAFIEYFATSSVASNYDFDKLMIPFRCVASDIVNRKYVVFDKGDLGRAIRASMSIPLVFDPIKIDSSMLYDGGLFNNFPWQVLEEDFHPGVIIGSKCVPTNKNFEEVNLSEQIFSLTMLSTDYNMPEGKSIMLERVMDDVSTLDFTKAREIIDLGYNDAMGKMDKVKKIISRRVDPAAVAQKRLDFQEERPKLVFDNLEITGLTESQTEYAQKLLGYDDEAGETFDLDHFKNKYFTILAYGQITSDYPDVIFDRESGFFTLRMNMKTKPALRVSIGGNISSTALNQAYIGMEYNSIAHSAHLSYFDGYFSPFHTSVSIGHRTDFYVKKTPFYYEGNLSYIHYNYFRSNFGYISRLNNMSYSKYSDIHLTGTVGTPVSRSMVANLSADVGRDFYRYYMDPNSREGDPLDKTYFQYTGAKLELERNTIKNAYAIRGLKQSISAIAITGKEEFRPVTTLGGANPANYTRQWLGARATREEYFNMNWFSIGYLVDMVYTTHPNFANEYATNITMPAFTPTQHSKMVYMKEFRSKSFVAAGVMPAFEFYHNLYLKTSAYTFLPDDYDRLKENIRQRLRYIFEVSLVYQTMIGPASISLSKYDVTRNNLFLTFNFGLTIFAPKGIFY